MIRISWADLGLFVLFALFSAVCIYLIVLIRNLNSSIKTFKVLLETNKDNVNEVMKNLPVVSKNLVDATDTAKNELKVLENAVQSITETAEMTAATAQVIKNDVVGKIKGVVDVVNIARGLFSRHKVK